ncbi:MAG: primosomal protein N' [Phycisphaeraceae bacterium]
MRDLFGEPLPPQHRPPDEPEAGPRRYAQVALEQGLEKPDGLTYLVPAKMALRVGDRVMVPLGRRNRPVGGYVLSISDTCELDPGKLKPIAARDAATVNLADDLVDLAKWISRYYCTPLGIVLGSVLPAAVKKGTGLVNRTYVQLHDPIAPSAVESVIETHRLRQRQADVLREAIKLAEAKRLPILPKALADAAGAKSVSPVKQLVAKGLLSEVVKREVQAIWAEHARQPVSPIQLNDEQKRAVAAITETAGQFAVHLLHGVTGSGKTEVYIRAIEPFVEAGKRAIVLVPEIALTPQTVGRFIGRFKNVAVLHSGLTAAQRHEQWALIESGWAQVVVGARSAVFAPMEDLGIIIVDEEHDNSYKQDQAPRYHARDVAIKRAQMRQATVVLGSATPSLESFYNAKVRRSYNLVSLPNRVRDIPLPRVQIVDLMRDRKIRDNVSSGGGLLSRALEQALRRTFDAGQQAMLLLNRRGYANYIACPDQRCGWVMSCNHCDVQMVYHLNKNLPTGGVVRCHYCSFENLLPSSCPTCGKNVTVFGLGTQRVEREIEKRFADIKFVRMDSDAMRTAKDYERALSAFGRGELQLLIGTQMIAKGLDFPNVKLVGVISADTALSLPDFRASERAFQLVCQVAGRSGRSDGGGVVIVQTFTPDHPAIELAAKHDYLTFAHQELEMRQHAHLPPITRMARIVCRDMNHERAQQAGQQIAEALRTAAAEAAPDAEVIGPMPAPIARIGDYFREQVEVMAPDAARLQAVLVKVRAWGHLRSDTHMAVDVDPVTLL